MILRSGLAAIVVTAQLPSVSQGQLPPVAIVNVSVVPMDRERVLVGQTVVVADGRISAMGPANTVGIPAGAHRIDGAGRFLMPGLADMHAHFATSGNATRDIEENDRLATVFVAHGVTTVRSMSGTPAILALRQRIDAGHVLGPQLHTTGPINGLTRQTVRRIATTSDADSLVLADKAAGYNAIKLTNLSPEIYAAFLAAGRREGMPVYGHVPSPVTFDMVAHGGLRSAEHVIPFAVALVPPNRRATMSGPGSLAPELVDWSMLAPLAKTLRDSGVWVCPTLVVAQRLSIKEKRRRLDDSSMRYVPRRLRDAWAADATAEPVAPVAGLLEFGLTLTRRLRDADVRLLLGSDDMNPYIVPGASLHEELAMFVRAGLSPFEALRAGTSDAATFLNRNPEVGTVAVGQRADLLLLHANPLENVSNADRRVGVMVAGRWFPEAELRRLLRDVADAFAR